jgi:hypothetical protein
MRVGPAHGAGGTCVGKSAATRARPIISPALGLTMDQMLVDHQSGPSSSGVTTSARSSARRMVSGSCRAATTAMRFGHVRDRWRVPLRLGRPKSHSKAPNQRWPAWTTSCSSRFLRPQRNIQPPLGRLFLLTADCVRCLLSATFETWQPALTMSVSRGRPEVVGRRPKMTRMTRTGHAPVCDRVARSPMLAACFLPI